MKLGVNGSRTRSTPRGHAAAVGAARVLGLTGTKFGCGMAQCGACTVHARRPAPRRASRSRRVARQAVTTIEGLRPDGSHPVQQAWIEEDVLQCGYCQSGQIMTAAALLKASRSRPTRTSTRDVRQRLPLRDVPAHPRAMHRAAELRGSGDERRRSLGRRRFLRRHPRRGGALIIGVPASRPTPRRARAQDTTPAEPPLPPNAFLRIGTRRDGDRDPLAHAEMGQGVWTALAMLVAEELDATGAGRSSTRRPLPLRAPRLRHPDDRRLDERPGRVRPLPPGGRVPRDMLVAAAAARWGSRPATAAPRHGA